MAGDLNVNDRDKIFRDMLDVCQLRGRDSTGVITVNRQMTYGYVKNVGPPAYLFDRRSYSEVVETGTTAALIGHCRAKTVGAVNIQNAHPFDFEDEGIIGVHNGTLSNAYKLDTYKSGKVDSEVLYGHLAKNGPEDTFSKLEGAWACVWWDNNAETVNFIRNDKRPMWFVWSKDLRKLFWASEGWMFGAVERCIDLWEGPKSDGHGKYIPLPVDTLWSFEITPNAKAGEPTIKFKQAKKIEPAPPLAQTVAWGNGSSRGSGVNGGSVPRPFALTNLDDQLPAYMLPKPETLALIAGEKKSTGSSTDSSSTTSKSGSESEKGQAPTTSGESKTVSLVRQSLNTSQKTNRKRLSVVPTQPQSGSLATSQVSFRSVAGMAFITDENTGNEYSEQQIQENTGGVCSFCDEPIGDLTEIHQFFGHNKFICTHCTEPKLRIVA